MSSHPAPVDVMVICVVLRMLCARCQLTIGCPCLNTLTSGRIEEYTLHPHLVRHRGRTENLGNLSALRSFQKVHHLKCSRTRNRPIGRALIKLDGQILAGEHLRNLVIHFAYAPADNPFRQQAFKVFVFAVLNQLVVSHTGSQSVEAYPGALQIFGPGKKISVFAKRTHRIALPRNRCVMSCLRILL